MRTPNADSKAGSHGNNSTEDGKKSIRIAGTGTSDKSKRKGKQDEIATKSLRQFINKIMR